MKTQKHINIFLPGAIPAQFIADSISAHQEKKAIGGHSIFLGQVRADLMDGKRCEAIEYTAYEEMANTQLQEIRETIIGKYQLSCMHVYHSLGIVSTGGICLFVFTSAPHRKAAIDACTEAVERIKAELPIWGRELFDNNTHQWKVNR